MEERLQGNPVSEGIAYAKSYIYIPGTLTKAPEFFPKGQEEEKYREFRESCEKADSELVTLYNGMCKEDPDKAKIFSAHRELLQDEEILDEIRETICEENMNPDSAVSKVYTEFAELLAGVEDPLIAERAADLRDVRDRLLRRRMYLRYQGKTDIFFPQKRSRKKFFKQTCNYEGRNRNKDRNQYRLAGI